MKAVNNGCRRKSLVRVALFPYRQYEVFKIPVNMWYGSGSTEESLCVYSDSRTDVLGTINDIVFKISLSQMHEIFRTLRYIFVATFLKFIYRKRTLKTWESGAFELLNFETNPFCRNGGVASHPGQGWIKCWKVFFWVLSCLSRILTELSKIIVIKGCHIWFKRYFVKPWRVEAVLEDDS